MTADEIRALLAQWAGAMARRDPPGVAMHYSDDCVMLSAMYGPGKGRSFVENIQRMFFKAFPDLVYEFEDPVIFGDQAIQCLTLRGIDTGGLFGQRPTGKPFSSLAVFLMTFGESLIIHERRIYDRGGLLLQLA